MIIGNIKEPFILFRTSGTTGKPRYFAHSRRFDENVIERGLICLRKVHEGEVMVNCFWPSELNGAYYFVEAVCRDARVSYIGLGNGLLEDLAEISQHVPGLCITTTGSGLARYLRDDIHVSKIVFIGDLPSEDKLEEARMRGIAVHPLAYATTEFGPIGCYSHTDADGKFFYECFDEFDFNIAPIVQDDPSTGELLLRASSLSKGQEYRYTGDIVRVATFNDRPVFEIVGRMEDSIKFQGGLLNRNQFDHQLKEHYGYLPSFQCIYSCGDAGAHFRVVIDTDHLRETELIERFAENYAINFALAGATVEICHPRQHPFVYRRGKIPAFVNNSILDETLRKDPNA